MKYIDIHTHYEEKKKDVISIFNFNAGDFYCRCGLDLQHTFYSLGLHPWKIREESWPSAIDFIEKNALFDNIKAIGECGLDKLSNVPMELQERAFLAQIRISENTCKPLIIHCVKALDELILFKKELNPKQPWIIHGFRGKPEQAEQLIRQGFFLSFGAKYNEGTLRQTPLDRFFLETDDSPDSIESIYLKVAASLDLSLEELIRNMNSNVISHFSI